MSGTTRVLAEYAHVNIPSEVAAALAGLERYAREHHAECTTCHPPPPLLPRPPDPSSYYV